MKVERYGRTRFWAVYDEAGALVCITVYKKGALEVVRRLTEANSK
jgi:YD repeat-containing protein